jgi:hypothetical protein
MDLQARTCDTGLVKSREMTGRSQTPPWWLGGEGAKTTEKNKLASLVSPFYSTSASELKYRHFPNSLNGRYCKGVFNTLFGRKNN